MGQQMMLNGLFLFSLQFVRMASFVKRNWWLKIQLNFILIVIGSRSTQRIVHCVELCIVKKYLTSWSQLSSQRNWIKLIVNHFELTQKLSLQLEWFLSPTLSVFIIQKTIMLSLAHLCQYWHLSKRIFLLIVIWFTNLKIRFSQEF